MCNCINEEKGVSNQTTIAKPHTWSNRLQGLYVSLDSCLVKEIKELWVKEVITTGCCCGHGKTSAYISVEYDSVDKMKELGYNVYLTINNPKDERNFIPKTLIVDKAVL